MSVTAILKGKLVAVLDEFRQVTNELDEKHRELAILKSEKSKLLSQRLKSYSEIDALERNKGELENKIFKNLKKISEFQKSSSECQKSNESQKIKQIENDSHIQTLQEKAQEAKLREDSMKLTYIEALQNLQDMQLLVENADKKETLRIHVLQELQCDKRFLESKLEQKNGVPQREAMLNEKIDELLQQLDAINARFRSAELDNENLGVELSTLEEEGNAWREKTQQMEQNLILVKDTVN